MAMCNLQFNNYGMLQMNFTCNSDSALVHVLIQHCAPINTSLTQRSFRGEREPPPSETSRLDREEVGRKELTGFSENMQPLVEPRDRDTARFVTHYQSRLGPLASLSPKVCATRLICSYESSVHVHVAGIALGRVIAPLRVWR